MVGAYLEHLIFFHLIAIQAFVQIFYFLHFIPLAFQYHLRPVISFNKVER